jgi:hypothetical protein
MLDDGGAEVADQLCGSVRAGPGLRMLGGRAGKAVRHVEGVDDDLTVNLAEPGQSDAKPAKQGPKSSILCLEPIQTIVSIHARAF